MRKFLSDTKGVAAVEFALTVALFLGVFFMNFELSRLALTTSYLDLGVAQSIRAARNAQINATGDYEKVFRETLERHLGSPEGTFMKFLLHTTNGSNGLRLSVKYTDCAADQNKCIDALLDGRFIQPRVENGVTILPSGTDVTLAYYQLEGYDLNFQTVFPFLPKSWISHTLSRTFITVQEYGRTAFPTGFTN